MARYIARRLLLAIPVLVGASFLIFAMVFALPGDPIRALAGDRPQPPSVTAVLRARYNLDDPLLVQYGKYVAGLAQGDLGTDFAGRPVSGTVSERFPVTLRLAVVAIIFEAVIGLIAGILSGIRKGSFFDNLVLVSTIFVVSIPVFVLAFVSQITLGLKLGLFPISGISQGWYSYLLPGFVLASLSIAYVARLTRTSLVENLRNDYVRTAKAKGLPNRTVVGKHTMRNSLIPVVTLVALGVPTVFGGAIVTEQVFRIPGVGELLVTSIGSGDTPVVAAIVLIFAVLVVIFNLIADVLYAVLDPRISYA